MARQYQETHITTGAHTLKINPSHWYRYSTCSSRKENWEDWAVSSAVGSRYTLPSVTAQSQAIASISLRPSSSLSNTPPYRRNVSAKMEAAAFGMRTPCLASCVEQDAGFELY